MAKEMRDIIQSMPPEGKQAFSRRSTGSIMVDRKVLCNITIVDETRCSVVWLHSLRVALKIEEGEAMQQFHIAAGGSLS